MRILVTGSSGFVGSYIVRAIAEAGHVARCLVRSSTKNERPEGENVEIVVGDLFAPETLEEAASGCDAVIHLVGIIQEDASRGITFDRIHVEGTRNVVAAARAAGVSTFVHMSANGAREDGISRYQSSKWLGEQLVRNEASFRSLTIIRPSLIFGESASGQPEFTSGLVRDLIKPFPVLPIFGDGRFMMQPIAVESVASAFVQAVIRAKDGRHLYEAGGPEAHSYESIVDIITIASGRKVRPKVHVPTALVDIGIRLAGWTGLVPVTRDQLAMLVEGNTCDHERIHSDFQIQPVFFAPESMPYLLNV